MGWLADLLSHPTGGLATRPWKLSDSDVSRSLITGKPLPFWTFKFRGIEDEAAFIRKMVERDKDDPALKEKVVEILREYAAPSRDEEAQAAALARWAQENLYYVHEGTQFFQRPLTTLRLMAGQCDDYTILLGAMLESIGIPAKLILMKVNGRWRHIFPAAVISLPGHRCRTGRPCKHRVPLDATLRREKYQVEDFPSPVQIAQARGDDVELLEA